MRQRLDHLTPSLGNVTFQGNLSLVKSHVSVIETGLFRPTNAERPLQGQSSYSLNAGLLFQSNAGGTEVGTFFNRFGQRFTAAGGSGIPDIYEQPRNQLDASFKQRLAGGVRFKRSTEIFCGTSCRRAGISRSSMLARSTCATARKALRRALERFGGQEFEFVRLEFTKGTEEYDDFRLHRGARRGFPACGTARRGTSPSWT